MTHMPAGSGCPTAGVVVAMGQGRGDPALQKVSHFWLSCREPGDGPIIQRRRGPPRAGKMLEVTQRPGARVSPLPCPGAPDNRAPSASSCGRCDPSVSIGTPTPRALPPAGPLSPQLTEEPWAGPPSRAHLGSPPFPGPEP